MRKEQLQPVPAPKEGSASTCSWMCWWEVEQNQLPCYMRVLLCVGEGRSEAPPSFQQQPPHVTGPGTCMPVE